MACPGPIAWVARPPAAVPLGQPAGSPDDRQCRDAEQLPRRSWSFSVAPETPEARRWKASASRTGWGWFYSSVVEQDDGFVVGNPAEGVFVKLPEIGVTAIEHLRNGHTIGQASQSYSASQEPDSEDVDVLDFTHTLIEVGFVADKSTVSGSVRPRPAERMACAGSLARARNTSAG